MQKWVNNVKRKAKFRKAIVNCWNWGEITRLIKGKPKIIWIRKTKILISLRLNEGGIE